MFELLELILASPIGVFIFAGLQDVLYAVIVAADCDECGFNDLGKLLFGGVTAAILVGVVISVLARRMKEKTPSASEFVSIRSPVDDKSLRAVQKNLQRAFRSLEMNAGIRSLPLAILYQEIVIRTRMDTRAYCEKSRRRSRARARPTDKLAE